MPEKVFMIFMREYLQAKSYKNFSGKFGKIWAKILRTPKNLPSSVPMIRGHMIHGSTLSQHGRWWIQPFLWHGITNIFSLRNLLICQATTGSQWRSQPKNFGGAKMFDFRRITLFCLEKRLSKHKMTIFSKNWGWHGFFRPPPWLRLCRERQRFHQHLPLTVLRENAASALACVQVWSDFSYPQRMNQCCWPPLAFFQWIAFRMFALFASFVVLLCSIISLPFLAILTTAWPMMNPQRCETFHFAWNSRRLNFFVSGACRPLVIVQCIFLVILLLKNGLFASIIESRNPPKFWKARSDLQAWSPYQYVIVIIRSSLVILYLHV